jgi:hypothetical protein
MRFIIHAKIPTEAGNNMLQDLNFIKNLEDSLNKASQKQQQYYSSTTARDQTGLDERYKSNTRESF